jgi:tetratricopeptide (TPR) repeat protein
MRESKGFFGWFLLPVFVFSLGFSGIYAQDETLAEIKYKEDYDRIQKITAVTQPVKRADLMLKLYKESPDMDPQLRAYCDNIFAKDLESLMKQENSIALKGLCERALKIRPKFGEVYFFQAVILRKEKKIEEAMNAFAKSYLIKNPLQKKAKELLDSTYRSFNKGSLIGQEKIIKKAMQEIR